MKKPMFSVTLESRVLSCRNSARQTGQCSEWKKRNRGRPLFSNSTDENVPVSEFSVKSGARSPTFVPTGGAGASGLAVDGVVAVGSGASVAAGSGAVVLAGVVVAAGAAVASGFSICVGSGTGAGVEVAAGRECSVAWGCGVAATSATCVGETSARGCSGISAGVVVGSAAGFCVAAGACSTIDLVAGSFMVSAGLGVAAVCSVFCAGAAVAGRSWATGVSDAGAPAQPINIKAKVIIVTKAEMRFKYILLSWMTGVLGLPIYLKSAYRL